MTTRQGIWDERSKTWIKPEGTVKQGRRPMFKPSGCDHDPQVTGYAWPEGGRAFPSDPPEYVRLYCPKCKADWEERWL